MRRSCWGLWCKFEVPWRPCESFQQLLVGGRTASVSEGHCSSDSVSMLSICACMRRDWGPACRREDSAVSVIALLLRIVVLFPLISACRAATLCTRDTINMNLLPLHSFSARHTAHCHVKAQAYERMKPQPQYDKFGHERDHLAETEGSMRKICAMN